MVEIIENMENVLKLLVDAQWVILLVLCGWYFREQITGLFKIIAIQLQSGAMVKWKDIEFRGVHRKDFKAGGEYGYRRIAAKKKDSELRHKLYNDQKNLFIVHRTTPSGKFHENNGLPIFDILVYLIPHKNYGRINDVSNVEYYFGEYFCSDEFDYGAKYVVSNGSDGFAIKTDAYGPTLCEAVINFHDGTSVSTSRYIDFESDGFRFDPSVIHDDEKRKARKVK